MAYWTLALSFLLDGDGGGKSTGKCLCYSPDVRAQSGSNDPVFEKSAVTPSQSSSEFTISATGSLCTTTGKGDAHFTGADRSHFDFSGETRLENHAPYYTRVIRYCCAMLLLLRCLQE